jgi:Na+-transporting NADH:ubiquinone oxidoreductase subunit C
MNESVVKTLMVSFVICLLCSLVVSFAAVGLRDIQIENKLNDQRIKILQAGKIYNAGIDVRTQFEDLEVKFINFKTGKLLSEFNNLSLDTYDQILATKDSSLSTQVPQDKDIAIIKNRENIGKVYIVRDSKGIISKLILPIRGFGLWGTMYGYISLENDFNTVAGIEFYQHKETPGLGAEVDNPKWKALWPGKQIYQNNDVALKVIKGKVESDDSMLAYKVDGLSGATLTSRGVSNMIEYWFSESGYSSMLKELDYES